MNHVGLRHVDPGTFSFVRFLLAAMATAALAVAMRAYDARLLRMPIVWLMGLFNALGFLLQYVAQELTSPAKAALLINANAVVVAVLAVLLLRERLTRSLLAGVLLAVVGVFLLTTGGRLETLREGSVVGDGLAFLAGATWSLFIILNKRYLTGRPAESAGLLSLGAAVFTTTAIFLVPVGFLYWPDTFLHVPAGGWWPIVYTGLLCSTAAYGIWTFALRSLSASTSAVVLLLEVPIAALLSTLLGYEDLTRGMVVGGVLLFAAIAYVSLLEARAPASGAPP